jgi:hypothetical protein
VDVRLGRGGASLSAMVAPLNTREGGAKAKADQRSLTVMSTIISKVAAEGGGQNEAEEEVQEGHSLEPGLRGTGCDGRSNASVLGGGGGAAIGPGLEVGTSVR